SLTVKVSSLLPQPRSSSIPPPRVYITVSRSGQIRSPKRVMSSPVLPMTVMELPVLCPSASEEPIPRVALSPLRNRAPPIPPAGTTIRMRPSLAGWGRVWTVCPTMGRHPSVTVSVPGVREPRGDGRYLISWPFVPGAPIALPGMADSLDNLTICQASQTRRRRSSRGEPLLKNETLDRLRLPAAWVMVGAVGALMLSGLISLITMSSGLSGSFPGGMAAAGGRFFGAEVILLLVGAVALVLTSERSRPSALPVVVAAMIMVGVGLLFVLINLITVFVDNAHEIANGFAGFLSTGAHGAVLGLFGFFLLKAFGDPDLVPRPTPQA